MIMKYYIPNSIKGTMLEEGNAKKFLSKIVYGFIGVTFLFKYIPQRKY